MVVGNPIRIRKIDHVVITTARPVEMMEFYRGVLGCTLERSVPEIGLYQLRAGSALIDLLEVSDKPTLDGAGLPGNMDHVCLALETWNEREIREHLARHGIEAGPTKARYGANGTGPSIYITDPEGNRVELKGRPSP